MLYKIFNEISYKNFRKFTFYELIVLFFPLFMIIGPAIINFILILCCFIFVKELLIKKINLKLVNTKWFYFYIFFIFYNVLNSFFSTDLNSALRASFGQLRFFFFALFIMYFVKNIKNLDIMIRFWFLLILLVTLDILVQNYFHQNIIGMPMPPGGRPSSFFGKEIIAGGYLAYMSIPVFFYFIQNLSKINLTDKLFYFFLYSLILLAITLTGERLSLLIFLGSTVVISVLNFNIKKIFILFSFLLSFFFLVYNTNNIFKSRINDMANILSNIPHSSWGRLWESSYMLFKNNLYFGVGLKNYRVDCDYQVDPRPQHPAQFCSTHPHNFVLEILSETGIVGFVIFSLFFFLLIVQLSQIYKNYNKQNQLLQLCLGNILILLIYVWPIKTSGSFFTTVNASYFWFNLGLALFCMKISSVKK